MRVKNYCRLESQAHNTIPRLVRIQMGTQIPLDLAQRLLLHEAPDNTPTSLTQSGDNLCGSGRAGYECLYLW